jgi:ribosomal protein S18 acetylase RimI-like enzyme
MNPYTLRPASIDDLSAMQELIATAMAQYAKDSMIPTKLEALCETAEDLKQHIMEDCFLLAFRGEHLVGTLRISPFKEHPGIAGKQNAYISRFAVLPSMQKRGVGKALFAKAEEFITARSYSKVYLHTALTNTPLVRFYTARKFELVDTATDRGYPRGLFMKDYHSDGGGSHPSEG